MDRHQKNLAGQREASKGGRTGIGVEQLKRGLVASRASPLMVDTVQYDRNRVMLTRRS